VRAALACGAEYIVAGNRTLTKRLTRRAHDEGLRVAVYTVDTEARLERARRYGVDAVITNVPALIRRR
jgi:glycerophosphoryl diester phosphodiesterase